jgi:hypothetical protein
VFPPDLDKGNLRAQFDVIVFNGAGLGAGGGRGGRVGGGDAAPSADAPAAGGGARGGPGQGGRGRGSGRAGFTPEAIPEMFAKRQGQVTAQTQAQIKRFVEEGGTVIAIGSASMGAATLFGLPVRNYLVENGDALPREKYYVPGSVLRVSIDNANPLAAGLGKELDVFFDNDPVFAVGPDAAAKGVRTVAWFASAAPLRSGWAWGQQYLDKGVAMLDATVGQGHVFMFGPEILFRSQPHGSYKLFFNGLYLSVAK